MKRRHATHILERLVPAQIELLWSICALTTLTGSAVDARDIGERYGRTEREIYHRIHKLVQYGFVDSLPDPEDPRTTFQRRVYDLTGAGRSVIAEHLRRALEAESAPRKGAA